MSRRILLVAYFYPPCRDTGALRPAAMAKWLRRLGHEVTVLTTSAYGACADDAERGRRPDGRRPALARAAARQGPGRRAVRLRHLRRPPPPAQQGASCPSRSRSPGRRSRARGRCALQRERRFDCVITTSPPGVGARGRRWRCSRRGVPWVADVRDAWTFEPLRPRVSDRGPATPRRAPRAPLARRRRRGRLRLRARRRRPARPRDRRPAGDPQRLGPRRRPTPRRSRPACSTRSASRSSTPAASAATGATRGRWSRRSAGSPARTRTPRRELELVVAGPLTDDEARLLRDRRLAGPDRPAGSLDRASTRSPCSARPTRCCCSPSRPAPSCSTSSSSSTWPPGAPILALAAGHRGRPGGRRARRARSSRPTTRRRSRPRWRRVAAGELAAPPADAVAAVHLPGARRADGGRGRGGDREPVARRRTRRATRRS